MTNTTRFQPPPTWELPIVLDLPQKRGIFSPIWLRWFIELVKHFNADGTLPIPLPVVNNYSIADGFDITIATGTNFVILEAAVTILSGSLTCPANAEDGSSFIVSTNQIVKSITVLPNTGQSIYNAPTCLNLNLNTPGEISGFGFGYVYASATSHWHRFI